MTDCDRKVLAWPAIPQNVNKIPGTAWARLLNLGHVETWLMECLPPRFPLTSTNVLIDELHFENGTEMIAYIVSNVLCKNAECLAVYQFLKCFTTPNEAHRLVVELWKTILCNVIASDALDVTSCFNRQAVTCSDAVRRRDDGSLEMVCFKVRFLIA